MPDSALGRWLRRLREARSLSLREVALRSEVDHAYIHRLETGAKEAPSEDVIGKLAAALVPEKRESDILRFLASHPSVDPELADFAAKDLSVSPEEFHMLTTVVNRGARPNYAVSLERIRRIMREDQNG
ncbi:MAG: helix-turn-helix domain-containing protein [Hyphomonadaceae bacterium]|nr:helix-turn-helix domain-containing protein [Hyphomonadaceae bacterium]